MSANDFRLPVPGPVRRLTFEYDGDRVALVAEQHIQLIVPPSQPIEAAESESGFTVILRDAHGKALYRLTRSSPMRHDAEVFSQEGEQNIQRVGVEHPRGAFTVLVPHVEGAEAVELIGQSLRPEAHYEAPRSLATFRLRPFEAG